MRGSPLIGALIVGLIASAAAEQAAAARGSPPKQRTAARECAVHYRAPAVDVDCPGGTLAGLLRAFEKSMGLRSEVPKELENVPVSVRLHRASPEDALRTALAPFNFATWPDPSSPGVTWVRVVGARTAAADAAPVPVPGKAPPARSKVRLQAAAAAAARPSAGTSVAVDDAPTQRASVMLASETPQSPASLFDSTSKDEMKRARQELANSVTQSTSLIPAPIDPQSGPRVSPAPSSE